MHQRSFSRFVLLLSWLSLLFNPAFTFAQKKPAQPNPRQILDRGVAAMGGKEKLQAIMSRHVVASVKRLHDGAIGRYELVTQYPSQFYYRLTVGNEFEQAGFNGITGYGITSKSSLKIFNEKDANLIYAESIYRNGYWFHDEHQRMSMSGGLKAILAVLSMGVTLFVNVDSVKFENEERANNRVLHGVRFDLQDFEADVRAYFDQATGRLAREELSFGKRLEIYSYDNYQAVNGILEPHTIRLKRANEEYEIKVENVIYNQAIDRSKFEVPAETQARLPPLSDVVAKAIAYQEKMLRLYDQLLYEERYDGCDPGRYEDDDNTSPGCWNHQTTQTVNFHKGFPVRWTDYDSWERLSYNKQASRFAEEVRQVEKVIAKKIKQGKWPPSSNDPLQHPGLREFTYDGWGVGIYEALTQSRLGNYRRQTIDGRDCYAVDFVRTHAIRPSLEHVGTVWIDTKEIIAYRMTQDLKSIPRFHKGIYKVDYLELGQSVSPQVFVQSPVCEGFWLPKSAKGHSETVFTNYRWKGREVTCTQKSLVQ